MDPSVEEPSEFALRHELLVLDAHLIDVVKDGKEHQLINALVSDLLITLGMQKLGPLETYAATDMRAPGWSFFQPITTSHISGHYFTKPGKVPHIHLDIYTCATFDWREAIKVVHRHLSLSKWLGYFLIREMNDIERTSYAISGIGEQIKAEILIGIPSI